VTGPYPAFPDGSPDELEMYLSWLAFLRGAVLRKADGLTDEQARWRPDGRLLPLVGLVNHLTGVEARWIDGRMRGAEVAEPDDEFRPDLPIAAAIAAYRERAAATDAAVRAIADLRTPSRYGHGTDLRWVLVHLINETARHAGHADAVRELLDGTVGE